MHAYLCFRNPQTHPIPAFSSAILGQSNPFPELETKMRHDDGFVFRPLPPVRERLHPPRRLTRNPLGPLADLAGTWGGGGFNAIWRPHQARGQGSSHFLELNLTVESTLFDVISGPIPNRGFLQRDIKMFGLTYLQQISDANLNAGLHIEPGVWAFVPKTANPAEEPTIVRMASVPHGTTILAQGTAFTTSGPPDIPTNHLHPFHTDEPGSHLIFPEERLSTRSPFRSPKAQLVGIAQKTVNNPNSLLRAAIAKQKIHSTTTLQISTEPSGPITGGGTRNTAFLNGKDGGAPNARAATMTATFWIETVQGKPDFLQLQYSQCVILQFDNISWPHVTVGTLRKYITATVPPSKIDPDAFKSK
jgi:hypothetical protein